jgi:hypothetical protein
MEKSFFHYMLGFGGWQKAGQDKVRESRASPRFVFVSRVRYLMHPDQTGETFDGLASNVSIGGLCLTVSRPFVVGQEILIMECILPYCRKTYKVRWTAPTGSGTYKMGLLRTCENGA